MQVFVLYAEEIPDNTYDRLVSDNRVKSYGCYFFYTGNEINEIENEYNVEFSNSPSALFDIFMDEINKELKFNYDMLDCREIFINDMELMDSDYELFVEDFDSWLDEIRKIFLEGLGWQVKNYRVASVSYENMLRNVARML